jgi:dephospho-CoA kinase
VVHELYTDPEVVGAVVGRWGQDVAPEGVVDRAAVARAAFASADERAWLEGQLWPRVGRRMWSFVEEQRALPEPPRAIVIEVPLLFESGMESGFDATLAIVADEAVRAERAGGRGHEAVDERTSRQLTQDEKARRATYVVSNEGTVGELESALSEVLDTLSPPP